MPLSSKKLHRARAAKNDEFYTQYADVKKECDNYLSHFFNKIIYCNCDTADSAFVKYFTELKAAGKIRDVWFSGGLGGDDFRSAESVRKLKAADIVVTNPPFSLFREFMDLLIENDKKFLVIGNHNSVMYKKVFAGIKENKIWFGVRRWAGGMYFITSHGMRGVSAVWFTNLHHGIEPPEQPYTGPVEMERYDNADAVNVNKSAHLPPNYTGVVGVPITFLQWYNPKKIEILGLDKDFTYDGKPCRINGKVLYIRLFIRRIFTN